MTSIFAKSARMGARTFVGIFVVALGLSLAGPVAAQGKKSDAGLMPATNSAESAREFAVAPGEETHPPVRLTPDRTEMVKLDEDANSIIIGNPAHLNVLLENPRLLLLAARQPGATQMTILNSAGKVIMQRHVIVSGPKEEYIRIRRSCINGGNGCQPTTVYYCPGICHDVRLLAGQANNNGNPGASIPSSNNGSAAEEDGSAPAEDEEIPLLTNDEEANLPDTDTDSSDTESDDSAE